MRQRPLMSFLAATVMMLLLISTTGCNARNSHSVGTGTTQSPGAAIFVSKNAPVMVSVLVNPDQLPALQRDAELSKLKTSLLANSDIDYQQDIQPWLGKEVTLAVSTLDIDRNSENGRQPGYLMALAIQQPEKSREFVELFFSKRALAGATLTVEQYKGVKLIYDTQEEKSPEEQHSNSSSSNSIAGAVVGDRFVLFANHPKVLREAINNVQAAELNLTSSIQYQQASKQLPTGALALTFLNLPTVAEWQGLKLTSQTYDSQMLSLVSKPKGLLAETTLIAKEDLTSSAQLSKPVGALQYIPSSAALAVAGTNLSSLSNSNLAQLWFQATGAISGSQEDVISRLAKPLGDWQKSTGINWKEDIFSWVHGEYAIGLLPREQTTPEWIFVAEKSETTPGGIARLDEIASSNGLSLNSINLDTQKITAWTELTTTKTDVKDRQSFTIQAKVDGVHTTVGNYEIFTNSIETMDEVLKNMENSLINNRNFQDSIAAIPQPNEGYVYLDWTKSQPILESEFPILKLLKVVGKPFFHNLRSLTVSSYGSEKRLLKGGIFFTTE
ncbi:MAG: DUF3352 domain-containing protein [Rhizonema sp. NSF051]|nr:DUF3352 domain-containing protein [Rhizonema sp. NSF051]